MHHCEGTFQGADGLTLYYQQWKSESEPQKAVLIVVHGFGEHSGRYRNLVDYLVPRGYVVYGFDHRGHGRSPGGRGYISAWREYREDVQAFVRLVGERESGYPLFLMGHSLGGLIALEYVLRHPEGLCGAIISGPPLGEIGVSPVLVILSRVLSRVWPTFGRDIGSNFSQLSRDPAVAQAWRDDPLTHSRGTARLGTEMAAAREWTNANAASLQVPLLMIHGGADRICPPAGSRLFFEKVSFPDRERREYEGGYHEPHNDIDVKQVLADVEDWLERHLPAARQLPTVIR